MSLIINQFYESNKIPKILLSQKITKLEQNKDIASEFEYWIENRTYKSEGAVTVEGYTAKALAAESKYLDGEGAFMMFIELREKPERALKQIKRGFKIK